MSAVIKKTKKIYQITLFVEMITFFLVFSLLLMMTNKDIACSFLLGSLAIFIPHCLFTFMFFFTKQEYNKKLTTFYRGEIVKFVVTIILLISIFLFIPINVIAFFSGYFVAILLNNLYPFVISKCFRI